MIFIIEPHVIASIRKLVEFAEANPLYTDDLLDMMNGHRPFAGNTNGYYLVDRFGTKIVYTIDVLPDYRLRHLSISLKGGKDMLHPAIVQEIMNLIGFKSQLQDCIVEVERRGNEAGILNVAEKIID